ncbi:hypothetical protein HPP92_004700 [Vanilla planifolia]|uniref:Uncharacterized protein n=1 Tax=Vanilla planifolia TaxID=51239 RepID=A0A835VAA3_VANPL|nr:hypothetical protein HPP92_004700 [Vanilla planifolia]
MTGSPTGSEPQHHRACPEDAHKNVVRGRPAGLSNLSSPRGIYIGPTAMVSGLGMAVLIAFGFFAYSANKQRRKPTHAADQENQPDPRT